MPKKRSRRSKENDSSAGGAIGKFFKVTKVTFLFGMVLVAFFAAFQIYQLVMYSEIFKIERIKIEGCERSKKDEIVALLPWKQGDNLWLLSLSDSVQSVLSHPWVGQVTVRRVLPRCMEVYVTERRPVAALPDQQGFLYYGLDPQGVVLPAVPVIRGLPHLQPDERSPVLPSVTGFTQESIIVGERLPEQQAKAILSLLEIVEGNYPQLRQVLFEYRVFEQGEVVGYPSSTVRKIHFGSQNFQERLARLAKVWDYLQREGFQGDYLDLRFDNQGVTFSLCNGENSKDSRSRDLRHSMNQHGGTNG